MSRQRISTLRRRRAATVLIAATLLSGCQTLLSGGIIASTAPADLPAPAASAVAGDLVPRLAEQIGPGQATIVLKPDGSVFGTALETSLRTWGYAVTTDPGVKDQHAIRLAYIVTAMDGQVLARLSTASLDLGRIYTPTPAGATPASPLSVMRRS
jgi:hypothetical protein